MTYLAPHTYMFRKLGELGRGSFGVVEKVLVHQWQKLMIGTMVYEFSSGSDGMAPYICGSNE